MANITLRQGPPGVNPNPEYTYKAAPLTHSELDANFVALDSAVSAGQFDSGIVINGNGIIVDSGDFVINNGDLNINGGDFHYDAALSFVDNTSGETFRLDSNQNLVLGITSNVQDAKLKVSRVGDEHILFGSRVSNNGQTTRLELGPAGSTNNTGAGLLATQFGTFNDWKMAIFTSSDADGHTNSIEIGTDGTVDFKKEVTFEQNVNFDQNVTIDGNINIIGDLNQNGAPIASGTVESVAMTVPTGLTVSGSPVTTTGTFAVTYDAVGGYSIGIPSDVTQASWDAKLDDAPNNANSYIRRAQSWAVLDSAALPANTYKTVSGGNGISVINNPGRANDRLISMTGQYPLDFSVNGNITATGDVTAFSDMAIKENIDPISDALNKVSQLGGYVFNRIDDDTRRYTGVMAQEVKSVLPEAVHGEDGNYSVAYGNMVGLLVEAIKELRAEVEELKKA